MTKLKFKVTVTLENGEVLSDTVNAPNKIAARLKFFETLTDEQFYKINGYKVEEIERG